MVKEKAEIVDRFVETLEKHRKECESAGKHLGLWELYPAYSSSKYGFIVPGGCSHCLTRVERPLNQKEYQEIRTFRESLRDLIT